MVKTYNGELYIIPPTFEKEVRADERAKVFDKIMSFINTSNRGNCDYFIIDQIENYINSNK